MIFPHILQIDHIVDVFTIPNALLAPELDDYARLSGQLDTQKAISNMIMEISAKPVFKNNVAMTALYGKYGNIIPYAMWVNFMIDYDCRKKRICLMNLLNQYAVVQLRCPLLSQIIHCWAKVYSS